MRNNNHIEGQAVASNDEFHSLKVRSFEKAEIPYGVNKVASISFNDATGSVVIQKRKTTADEPVLHHE